MVAENMKLIAECSKKLIELCEKLGMVEEEKTKYPKTFEECCEILNCSYNIQYDRCETAYESNLHNKLLTLRKLIICRDAYWQLYGEEMGLGKSWEPDWDSKDNHFYTIYTFNGKIECSATAHRNAVLIFPTAEMRDAFKENFDPDIEICKELL